jgi:aspartate/methionine/tyrosine aminotransferase
MGVKQGLTIALMAILNPDQEVIVEDPCFVSYQPLIRLCEGKPVSVPLKSTNAFRWDRENLESAINRRTCAILLNSPQNPTGTVYTAKDLEMIASLARAHDLFVITDEIYERVTWAGRRHVSMATLPGMRERTITIMGLTKTFSMGGWRIGFIYAPPQVIDAMVKLQQHLLTCVGSFVQAGSATAYGEPPRPEVLALWSDWEKRCTYVASELNAIKGVSCHPPEGGFYAWADVSAIRASAQEIAETLLREHHVAVVPGSAFGPSGEDYLRITCVKSWEDLREGMQRIRRGLSQIQ